MTGIATVLLTSVVGGALICLPAQASTLWLDIDPTGSITINGTATGTAAAGTSSITGMPTTATQLANAQTHAAGYDGATQFTAKYDITLNAQNMFVAGTVTFVTNSYTSSGTTVTSDFTTQPITITGATVNPDGSIASIDFSSTNWYPANGTGAGGLTNNGLSGTINLKAAPQIIRPVIYPRGLGRFLLM